MRASSVTGDPSRLRGWCGEFRSGDHGSQHSASGAGRGAPGVLFVHVYTYGPSGGACATRKPPPRAVELVRSELHTDAGSFLSRHPRSLYTSS